MAIFKWNRAESKKSNVETTEIETWNDRYEGSDGREGRGEESPKTLSSKGYAYWTVLFFDVLLSLLPVCFIVLAALALTLQDKPKSAKGEKIVQITLLSPTLFPIIYAAVVGKLLRRIGLYKAERGTKLRTLERLMGSHSVFTAIERQIGLRNLDFLGIFLIVLWLLSPLGGQASLRLLTTTPRVVPINDTFRYFPIEGYMSSALVGQNSILHTWSRYAPLYMTNLHLARTYLDKPMDIWGAVRIPDIKYANATTMDGGWRSIDNSTNTTYASLFGLPIAGVPDTGNTTFDLSSHYWSVECGDFTGENMIWNGTATDQMARWFSFRLDMPAPTGPMNATDPQAFTYTSLKEEVFKDNNYSAAVSVTNCVSRLKYVESRVRCAGRNCGVEAMREYNRTGFPFPKISFFQIAKTLPGTDIGLPLLRTAISGSELTEHWIADPRTTFDDRDATSNNAFVDVASLSKEDFSQRLQLAINTFWDSTVGGRFRTENITLENNGEVCPDCTALPPIFFNSTASNGVKFDGEKYVCSMTFAILTIVISWILFTSATISVVLAAGLIKAPDILGYISTYLRDNPYSGVVAPSHLDGLDTARLFGDVVVAVGDVKGQYEVGHVSFGATEVGVKRLDRKRLYD